jgi:hypothetical protein
VIYLEKDTSLLQPTPAGVWVPDALVEPTFVDKSFPENDKHLGT